MKLFRTQVTILLFTAQILLSILSILAAVVVYRTQLAVPPRMAYHIQSKGIDSHGYALVAPLDIANSPDIMVVLGFATLVVAAAAMVSILIANMVVRPLVTIQSAVESVNPQAIIPRMAEKGDGADLITVRLMNTLSDRLRSAMESRMRLVAAAGHDMRTPLTRMRLRAEMIDEDATRLKWTDDIDELMHIADSAIALVKEEVNSREYEVIRLDELLEDLVAELEMVGHHVRVENLVEASIACGPHAMKRAFTNLLVNACTHGDKASLSMTRDGDHIVIGIRDEGPGIPEDMLQHAFEPFFRADPSRSKSVNGAGLGLAIVNEIIGRHGGSITLANRKPHGLYQEVVLRAS